MRDYQLEQVLIYISYHATFVDKQLFTLENIIRVKYDAYFDSFQEF